MKLNTEEEKEKEVARKGTHEELLYFLSTD